MSSFLTKYGGHKWFACSESLGIVASGNTIVEVYNKINPLKTTFIFDNTFEFESSEVHDGSSKPVTYSVYFGNKLLNERGFYLDSDSNTWSKNIEFEESESNKMFSLLNSTGRFITFYNRYNTSKINSNILYKESLKFLKTNELFKDILDLSKKTSDLLFLINNYDIIKSEQHIFSLLGINLKEYTNYVNLLLKKAIIKNTDKYSTDYLSTIAYFVSDIMGAILREYYNSSYLSFLEGDFASSKTLKRLTVYEKTSLDSTLVTLNALYGQCSHSLGRYSSLDFVNLLNAFVDFKKYVSDYKFEKEKTSLDYEYLRRLYTRLCLSAENVSKLYSILNDKYPYKVKGGSELMDVSEVSLGLLLFSEVSSFINDEFSEDVPFSLLKGF